MARRIYEVYAKVVDANGNYNTLNGYPKSFDSRNFEDDVEKTLNRARAEYYSTLGQMYLATTRKYQMILLISTRGDIVDLATIGSIEEEEETE